MPDVAISALPAAAGLVNADVLPAVTGGTTSRASRAQVLTAAAGEPIALHGNGGGLDVAADGTVSIPTADGRLSLGTAGSLAVLDVSGLTAPRTYTLPDADTALGGGGGGAPPALAIRTVTADATMAGTDDVLLVDATAGPVTITLPAVATAPKKRYLVKKIDSTTNAVTVASPDSTIDGGGSRVWRGPLSALDLVTDQVAWWVASIGGG